jgi:hypothetical protein
MIEPNFPSSLDSLDSFITNCSTPSPVFSMSPTNADRNVKIKLKKDALEFVDCNKEYQHDPKYKTELCKTWTESGFCAYGNKCRFAHGRQELFDKVINCKKYKQKECMSFFRNKYCCYGSRCHFRHEERKLSEIDRSYFTYLTQLFNFLSFDEIENLDAEAISKLVPFYKQRQHLSSSSRLPVFSNLNNYAANGSTLFSNQHFSRSNRFLKSIEAYSSHPKFTLNYLNPGLF